MKKIFYGTLIVILLCLLLLLPLAYLSIFGSSNDFQVVKQNCLNSGGTVVEYPEGKFERCIPR